MTDTDSSTIWPFREACLKQKPVFIEELGSRGDGREDRGFADPIRNAVVIPILDDTDGTVKSVIIVGLNPRRPWDDGTSIQIFFRESRIDFVRQFTLHSSIYWLDNSPLDFRKLRALNRTLKSVRNYSVSLSVLSRWYRF